MKIPSIHLNGSSADSLQEALRTAVEALENAREAMARVSPHGRDYYPQGPEVIGEAIAEHQERVKRITDTVDELTEIFFSIDKQSKS